MKFNKRKVVTKKERARQAEFRRALEARKELKDSSSTYGLNIYSVKEDEKLTDEHYQIYDEAHLSETNKSSITDVYDRALWVFEPDDLNDLSVSDVRYIWKYKEKQCGSLEAAAEALAILRVADGVDSSYQGWQALISADELKGVVNKLPHLLEVDQASFPTIVGSEKLYSFSDVKKLSLVELKKLWADRYNSFESLSAACEALAIIRYQSKIDGSKREWREFLSTETIQELMEYIEDEKIEVEVNRSLESSNFLVDNRRFTLSNTAVREGQKYFREKVMLRFNFKCVVTGISCKAVLESAHIMPYMGKNSNIMENGLLLRVDIHRLFDAFLLSINPVNSEVIVSDKVSDDCYKKLNCKKILFEFSDLTKKFLLRHYSTFLKKERVRD